MDAYKEIFERYWERLFRMAYIRTRSREDAEELIQELFTTLWQKRTTLLINNLSAYLHVSVKKRLISYIRSRITQEKYWQHYAQYIPDHAETTQEAVAFNELNSTIEQIISRLPEKSQQVFRLNRLEGRSIPEIAAYLKLSRRSIEHHLTRSLKELRLHLKDFIFLLLLLTSVAFLLS